MTRYEWIKKASKEELAEMLCDLSDNTGKNCVDCVAYKMCNMESGGFNGWLDKEVEFTENTKALKVYE